VLSLGLSLGATVPFAMVDYLSTHATHAWITGGERAGATNTPIDFGDVCIGAAQETRDRCQNHGLDRDNPISIFAARQFWAAQYSMQRLRALTALFNQTSTTAPSPPTLPQR
jgi:hypothetical protein